MKQKTTVKNRFIWALKLLTLQQTKGHDWGVGVDWLGYQTLTCWFHMPPGPSILWHQRPCSNPFYVTLSYDISAHPSVAVTSFSWVPFWLLLSRYQPTIISYDSVSLLFPSVGGKQWHAGKEGEGGVKGVLKHPPPTQLLFGDPKNFKWEKQQLLNYQNIILNLRTFMKILKSNCLVFFLLAKSFWRQWKTFFWLSLNVNAMGFPGS